MKSKPPKNKHRKHLQTRISTAPPHRRTLLPSTRKTLRHSLSKNLHLRPWLNDRGNMPAPRIYARASLMGLPREIREMILCATLSLREMRGLGRKEIGRWIGELSSVCAEMGGSMVYVGAGWKKEKRGMEEEVRKKSWKVGEGGGGMEGVISGAVVGGKKDKGKGKGVLKAKRKKKTRDRKCWFCERRHYSRDPVCPPAREDPEKWVRDTKVVKGKRGGGGGKGGGVAAPSSVFMGKKIVFDD